MPPVAYRFQTPAQLMQIDQVLRAALTKDDPIFKLFPERMTQFATVRWTQRDSYSGLAQARSLNGSFAPVPEVNSKTFSMTPGYYGERREVTEEDLTLRTAMSGENVPISVNDLTAEAHMQLLHRDINRERFILWQLVLTGYFKAYNSVGSLVDLAYFNPKKFVPNVPWSNTAAATPLADLRVIAATYDLGSSTSFMSDSELWLNQTSCNYLIGNTNASDLGGVKINNSTIQGMADLNEVMRKNNLPQIKVHNESYLDDTGIAGRWIPDGYFALFGKRPNNEMLGEFLLTRNVNNPGAGSQVFVKTTVKGLGENEDPPVKVSCFRGFNGGPAIYYPGSYVAGKVN